MTEKSFRIPNIGCDHCTMTIKRKLGELEGIASVDGDVETKTVTVEWDFPATWDSIKSRLTEIDYPPAD